MTYRAMCVSVVSCFLVCVGSAARADDIEIVLPCTSDGWYLHADECESETIYIPGDRPVYALLVSGFHQNRHLDMLHWFDFAKYLQQRGAYVHYAWWNNLLAPYMGKPLHWDESVPSTGPVPAHDSGLFRIGDWTSTLFWDDPTPYPTKAIPADDHQFQQDARKMLFAIRQHDPDAKIILVGHSMGGGAVVRLAESLPANFDIDLLAPIDPVGNRTCIQNCPGIGVHAWTSTCNGLVNFTRWRAVRIDAMDNSCNPFDPDPLYPPKREFGSNIKYLYHRWQQESGPPFDFACPEGHEEENYLEVGCDLVFYPEEEEYLFSYAGDPGNNDQSIVDTHFDSGKDVPVLFGNFGGTFDGHGELVGFRGFLLGGAFDTFEAWLVHILANPLNLLEFESYPLGLLAEGDWPAWDVDDPLRDAKADARVAILKAWENDPFHLYKLGHEPWNPGLCMVSRDLSNILDGILPGVGNHEPTADAGPDQTVSADESCIGHVTLDGTGSTDQDADELTHRWTWNGTNTASGPNPTLELPLGVHEISLIVSDGQVDSMPDTVVITVVDDSPPVISLDGEANRALECAVDSWEDPGAAAADNCDQDVEVEVGGDTVDPAATDTYIISYDAVDDAGNAASRVIRTVVVQDTIPPAIEGVIAVPASLWPPNHQMVPVRLEVSVYDSCDLDPTTVLAAVTSSEPDDAPGGGDGHTVGDIQEADIGTPDYALLLRAERQGEGDGRVYSISYTAVDDAGNASTSGTAVTVGHDRGPRPDVGRSRQR